jgi:hypothetical protein
MFRKFLFGALAALILSVVSLGAGAQSASAEVVNNYWLATTVSRDNPCEAGTVPISLSGLVHSVWYTTPDGTLKMEVNGHLTGSAPDGTQYIANVERHMEHFAWPSVLP